MGDTVHDATAYLGLGSNLGDRIAVMRAAVAAVDAHHRIHIDFDTGVASLYETTPVGAIGPQSDFYNSAVRVETSLQPLELLHDLLAIETSLGRVRHRASSPPKGGPHSREARIIDIDLLLYEDVVYDDEALTLPHPRLHERRFVLDPLAEIAGDLLHPGRRVTVASLAREITATGAAGDVVRIAGQKWALGDPK